MKEVVQVIISFVLHKRSFCNITNLLWPPKRHSSTFVLVNLSTKTSPQKATYDLLAFICFLYLNSEYVIIWPNDKLAS